MTSPIEFSSRNSADTHTLKPFNDASAGDHLDASHRLLADAAMPSSPTFADAAFTVATTTAETLAVPIVGAAVGFTVLEAGTVVGAIAAGTAAGVLAAAAGYYLFDGNDLPKFSKDVKSDFSALMSKL